MSFFALKILAIFALFTLLAMQMSLTFLPAASGSDENWRTAHIVGRFHSSSPPKPDQIFIIQYRVVNGTIESFKTPESILINVTSVESGLLQVKFPRNYPYHNDIQSSPASNFLLLDKQNNEIERNVTVTDCFFVFSVPFRNDAEIKMTWTYLLNNAPARGDDVPASCTTETIIKDVPVKKNGTIRPLYQVRAGVAPGDVLCPEGMEVFVRATDDKPYCVTPPLAEKLIERGWQRKE